MQVLVCGANGFIGAAVCEALVRAGHRVRRGVRTLSGRADEVRVDFAQDQHVEAWLPRLVGVDAVVNAVGTLSSLQLRAVHSLTPSALFAACARSGVARVVQISALGAAADAPTRDDIELGMGLAERNDLAGSGAALGDTFKACGTLELPRMSRDLSTSPPTVQCLTPNVREYWFQF